jgi:MoaD family protein
VARELRAMVVHFKFYTLLREIIGKENLRLRLKRGATVQEAFDRLVAQYGWRLKKGLFHQGNWVIMLNNKNIKFLNDLKTPLKDGDRIAILSPLSGG